MGVKAIAKFISGNLADPYDQYRSSGNVCIDGVGPNTPYPWTVLTPLGTSAVDMNAAMIAAAKAAALVAGYTVDDCQLISAADIDPAAYSTTTAMNAAILAATTGLATSSAVTSAIASATANLTTKAYVDAADAARLVLPVGGTPQTLTLGTARQPSATRPVAVTVSGTWTTSLSASGALTFQSDSNTTPTTIRADAQPAVTLAVGIGITLPWSMTYMVPAGHYYRIVASGTGTFAITKINETTL